MRHLSDEQLVRKIARGSHEALEEFYERYAGKTYNLSMGITKDHQLAEDAVSRSFVALWRKAKTFRGDAKARCWFYRIATNTAFMILRERKKLKREELMERVPDGVAPDCPLQDVSDSELREAIKEAIKNMEPVYRTVFLLRDVEGLKNEEVATVLGITVPAVKSRTHRARLDLQARLSRNKAVKEYKKVVGFGS